jgi:hypothetical protein
MLKVSSTIFTFKSLLYIAQLIIYELVIYRIDINAFNFNIQMKSEQHVKSFRPICMMSARLIYEINDARVRVRVQQAIVTQSRWRLTTAVCYMLCLLLSSHLRAKTVNIDDMLKKKFSCKNVT